LPTKSTKIKSNPRGRPAAAGHPPSPQFLFYGGKGGVGKTTCAAARAVAAARAGGRVLVVSTDPAHSLGDVLGVRLSARPTRVGADLLAVELDAPRAFARWIARHRQALGDIVEHGTWLDREDAEALLGLSIPGIDELIGLIEIERLGSRAYDLVVIDTAPTGHTLRLLAAPETVAAVASVFEAMQREHRVIREQLARVGRPEAADRLIVMLAEHARETGALLRDAGRSTFYWVMLPEELSLAESEDGLAALDRAGIAVAEVIVNRVTPDGPACPTCDRRRTDERRVLAEVPRRLGRRRRVRIVAAESREPRGVAALARFGRALTASISARPKPPASARIDDEEMAEARRLRATSVGQAMTSVGRATRNLYAGRGFRRAGSRGTPPESVDAFRGAQLLFFGGKGGVGKTTCAAAAALGLARADPTRRVLLISTDPAHSLGDVFGAPVGDRPRSIARAPRNLRVRELDPRAVLAARRADLEAAIDEIVTAFDPSGDTGVSASASGLMDLAPPGIDELLGLIEITRLAQEHTAAPLAARGGGAPRALIIVDTAPTGHALRLLEMPEMAHEWAHGLLRILLKYRALVHPGQFAAALVELSKSIRRLRTLLRDPVAARFIVVTRAAEVPRLETERLLERLRRLKLSAPAVVINAMTPAPGTCPRCRATAAAEHRVVAALTRVCRRRRQECVIILTPLSAPPPRGVAAIDRWARSWRLLPT
jgi:arsenite-transporting ATPase